jgi:hypothetical protein
MAGRGPAHLGRKVDDRHRAIAACAGNARRSLSFARYLGLDGSTRRIELASPHIRSVMAIVVRSADLECPSLEAVSSRALDRNIIG